MIPGLGRSEVVIKFTQIFTKKWFMGQIYQIWDQSWSLITKLLLER